MSERILIIEDEEKIARILSIELSHEGYETDRAATGRQGLEKAQNERWDLILLDIMLPELNGIEVLRRIRAAHLHMPIIILTARGETPDIVGGLDQGANDYIAKPFEIEELLARIRAAIRQHKQVYETEQGAETDEIRLDSVVLKTKSREVIREDQPIELTPKEYDLFVYLMENKNEVLSREQIMQQVWGYDFIGDTNTVDVYIRYLRKKIDEGFGRPLIRTVRGVGYCIKEYDQ